MSPRKKGVTQRQGQCRRRGGGGGGAESHPSRTGLEGAEPSVTRGARGGGTKGEGPKAGPAGLTEEAGPLRGGGRGRGPRAILRRRRGLSGEVVEGGARRRAAERRGTLGDPEQGGPAEGARKRQRPWGSRGRANRAISSRLADHLYSATSHLIPYPRRFFPADLSAVPRPRSVRSFRLALGEEG